MYAAQRNFALIINITTKALFIIGNPQILLIYRLLVVFSKCACILNNERLMW